MLQYFTQSVSMVMFLKNDIEPNLEYNFVHAERQCQIYFMNFLNAPVFS